MIRFSLLGSGSSGNAILATSNTTKILIDNGLSFKQLRLRSDEVGLSIDDLDAVFITHEHGDHVLGLGTLARRIGAPVFMTRGTYESLPPSLGALPNVVLFEAGDTIPIGNVQIESFSVAHDASDPVSYVVQAKGVRLGLATDMGHASTLVERRLSGCHGLVLESNYCPKMLRNGAYPIAVKQRISGRHGHLSNTDMCRLLGRLLHDALKLVVLVHISDENNTLKLAHTMATRVVGAGGPSVFVARKDRPTRLFEIAI